MKKSFVTKSIVSLLVILFFTFSISSLIYSYGTGVSGRTQIGSSPGCTCHSSSTTAAVTPSITGPTTLSIGQTGTYSFTITRSSGTVSKAGIDIAVSSGTLGIGSSSGIKLMNGDITHSSAFSSSTTKSFTFTAPNTPGTVTMAVTGAAGSSSPPNWNNGTSITITITPLSGVIKTEEIAKTYNLSQNYPNPFNPTTKIGYSIPKSSLVTLSIYNVLGEKVATLVNEKQEIGSYSVDFDASKLSSGVYYYKIEAGEYTAIKKMNLIK